MASVQQHYKEHLGPVYGWMMGEFDEAVEAAREELRAAGLLQTASTSVRRAVDLGAGLGPHSIALAEAGYVVTAIDDCEVLLDQLRSHDDARITCISDDLTAWRRHCEHADVVLCMGDTLTHLPSQRAVESLLKTIAKGLNPGGMFVATFRNYASSVPAGETRFIPVRSGDDRILTCVLEYGRAKVTVHDLLHERTGAGWAQRISSYTKLRLGPEAIRSTVQALGLTARIEAGPKGMVRLIARRS